MDLSVTTMAFPAPSSLPFEIVERKGRGHPDTICDALAENLSVALSRFYLDRFGRILHHNVDKGLLWGGAAAPRFGGGAMLKPIEIFLAGRATTEYRGVRVPVEEIAVESARAWIKKHLPRLDPERHVRIHALIRPSSPDLVDLFMRQSAARAAPANDTSFGAGFAPLDALEQAVLQVEHGLNSDAVKHASPEVGEDIKVMGARRGAEFSLTVACAFIDRYVADLAAYRAKKERLRQTVLEFARPACGPVMQIEINTADGDSENSIYLTVTGTSAEAGDDGEVGRGNRVNGLITPYRPMSLEAAAGKNPVTHVGKLYNVLAHRIAGALVADVDGVAEAYCTLLCQIGRPIDEPRIVDLKVRLADGAALQPIEARIAQIARSHLAAIGELWRELLAGTLPVC